jgi:hypothetical protein
MLRWLAILGILFVAQPAWARDYDRNDVAERELSLGFGLAPVDVDPRNPQACAAPNAAITCIENSSRPAVLLIRGTARHHIRHFYLAGELELGATMPVAEFPAHPWLAAGGAVGFETSGNAWDLLRGYGEIGILGVWANTTIAEILTFTAEAGVRYQIFSAARPHMLLHLGVRGMYNFSYFGVMSFAGVSWTFD